MTPEETQAKVARWTNALQFSMNYFAIALASIAGAWAEALAHVKAGNGLEMGIPLSIISVAALTVAAVTKDKKAWAFYILQLSIGVAQMPSYWLMLLSLASLPAAYAAANMLVFSLESQQQDKSADRDHELKSKEMELKHAERMAKIEQKQQPESVAPSSNATDWTEAQNMRDNGLSLREIASMLGVSPSTVSRNTVARATPDATPEIHLNGTH